MSSGHSRLKQGLHGISIFNISARCDSGGVSWGCWNRYKASMGRSSAAAICIRPESLLTTRLAQGKYCDSFRQISRAAQIAAAQISQRDNVVADFLVFGRGLRSIPRSLVVAGVGRVRRNRESASVWRGRIRLPGKTPQTGLLIDSPNLSRTCWRWSALTSRRGCGRGEEIGTRPVRPVARIALPSAAAHACRACASRLTSRSAFLRQSRCASGMPAKKGISADLSGV